MTTLTVACTDQGADQGPTTSTLPLPVAEDELSPVVVVDDSPFCRTLLALDDDDDPPSLDELTATYVDLVDDVPAEIRGTFDVVLAGLLGDDDAIAEFAEAAELFAEYVQERCRGTVISPLPPPTTPP